MPLFCYTLSRDVFCRMQCDGEHEANVPYLLLLSAFRLGLYIVHREHTLIVPQSGPLRAP